MLKVDDKFDENKNYGFTEDFESDVRSIYEDDSISVCFSEKTKQLITASEFHYDEVMYQMEFLKEHIEEIKSKGKFSFKAGYITRNGITTPIINEYEITYKEYLSLVPSDVWLKINLDIKEELLLSIVADLQNCGKLNIFEFVELVKSDIESIGDEIEN